jgi:hypothetical protein
MSKQTIRNVQTFLRIVLGYSRLSAYFTSHAFAAGFLFGIRIRLDVEEQSYGSFFL